MIALVKYERILLVLLVVTVMIGSWTSPAEAAQDKPLVSKMKKIVHLVNDQQWDQAIEEVDGLKKLYNKEKWKLQLLGDEAEYEQIDQELEKLTVAVKERDRTQAKIIMSTVRTLLKNIYSM